MKRKEMFEIIKKNDWNKEIVAMFGKNMTQVSSENLSMFITDKGITEQAKEAEEKEKKKVEKKIKEETPKEKTVILEDINTSSEDVRKGVYVNKVAFIELISILQSESCIKGKDAERILKLI